MRGFKNSLFVSTLIEIIQEGLQGKQSWVMVKYSKWGEIPFLVFIDENGQ